MTAPGARAGHSPGPWEFVKGSGNARTLSEDKIGGIRSVEDGFWIAEICGDCPEWKGNVEAILSLPALLAANTGLVARCAELDAGLRDVADAMEHVIGRLARLGVPHADLDTWRGVALKLLSQGGGAGEGAK